MLLLTRCVLQPERGSKRGSRREGHRDDRARRTSEKEGSREQPRESDRRRKERDAPEGDAKATSGEKVNLFYFPALRVQEYLILDSSYCSLRV